MPSSFPALDPCPDEPEEDSGRDDGDRETYQGEAESLKICHVEPPFDRPLPAPASPPRAAPGSPGRGPAGSLLQCRRLPFERFLSGLGQGRGSPAGLPSPVILGI